MVGKWDGIDQLYPALLQLEPETGILRVDAKMGRLGERDNLVERFNLEGIDRCIIDQGLHPKAGLRLVVHHM
jgi:hypothetical protein